MYLAFFLVVLAVLFVIVGIASGGAFTIVLVPLAVIALVAGVAALMSARAAGVTSSLFKQPDRQSTGLAPRGEGPPAGEVPVSPDEFTEARQKSQ